MSFDYSINWDYFPAFVSPAITTSDSISENISVTVYPDWYTSSNLTWSYPAGWGSLTTNIYKAQTENGPFVKLNATPLGPNINSFKDTTTMQFSKIYEDWYIVEGTLSSGKRIQSPPTTWRNVRNNFAQIRAEEITRREYLLLRKFTGVKSFLFSRKTYGKRCDECWSYTLGKVIKDKCLTCYGSSFEGGFWEPAEMLLQYDADPNDITLEYFGRWEKNNLAAWTITIPTVNPRDVVYRISDGKLFLVEDKNQTSLQTEPVRQMFRMVELDKTAIEHALVKRSQLI